MILRCQNAHSCIHMAQIFLTLLPLLLSSKALGNESAAGSMNVCRMPNILSDWSQVCYTNEVIFEEPLDRAYLDGNKNLLPEYTDADTYSLCMLHDEKDEKQKAAGFRQHGFNEFVSNKIGLIRAVPDVRNPVCKNKTYSSHLPTVSIVMCFYNEAWSTLLRSIHSLERQTPAHLLHEIILLDDASALAHLKEDLDDYLRHTFTKVKLIRSEQRLGLIRARMKAASHATGEVLVFLDSHIEAGESWLEPLLDRIAMNRKTVVIPVVDTIEAETMIYRGADLVRGGFTWTLLHNWEPLPIDVERAALQNADPFISPTMPGGLFAMDRKYFYELGEYDAGMDIWGGENMEISFRIWQCGGKLEIVPCSRVGHVFRQFRPYGSGQDTATRNAARVAEVWLDEYKKHFYDLRPEANNMNFGDVTDRVELRKRLGCKSFKWFLENIHPEQIVPGEKPKAPNRPYRKKDPMKEVIVSAGQLMHSGLCIQSGSIPPSKDSPLRLTKCDRIKGKFGNFILTDDRHIKLRDTRFCLETSETKQGFTRVYLMKCHGGGGTQTWLELDAEGPNAVLFNPASGKCLSRPVREGKQELSMNFCSSEAARGFKFVTV